MTYLILHLIIYYEVRERFNETGSALDFLFFNRSCFNGVMRFNQPGRPVDYFNSWNAEDERNLLATLERLPCRFLLSTWHGNEYRDNPSIQENWQRPGFFVETFEHFYHVGAIEELRNAMVEALIANYDLLEINHFQIAQHALGL